MIDARDYLTRVCELLKVAGLNPASDTSFMARLPVSFVSGIELLLRIRRNAVTDAGQSRCRLQLPEHLRFVPTRIGSNGTRLRALNLADLIRGGISPMA